MLFRRATFFVALTATFRMLYVLVVIDDSIAALGIEVLRSLVGSPKANSVCERVIGTMRRECLNRLAARALMLAKSVLGGLRHEYSLTTTGTTG